MDQINKLIETLQAVHNKHIRIDKLMDIYLNKSKSTNRQGTFEFYEKQLNIVVTFLINRNITSTSEITHGEMYNFINHQKSIGHKNNTINKALKTLKQALSYAEDLELISKNPLVKFKNLKSDDIETQIIDNDTVYQIIHYLEYLSDNDYNLRTKLIFFLILDTGIRLTEFRNLTIHDLNLKDNSIYMVYTKSSKNRTVFFSDKTKAILIKYLHVYKPEKHLLIDNLKRTVLTRSSIQRNLNQIKKDLKLNFSLGPHRIRHTFATMCLENGADLEFVRKTLGHANLRTTQKYLHVSTTKLQEQHVLFSPLAKL